MDLSSPPDLLLLLLMGWVEMTSGCEEVVTSAGGMLMGWEAAAAAGGVGGGSGNGSMSRNFSFVSVLALNLLLMSLLAAVGLSRGWL